MRYAVTYMVEEGDWNTVDTVYVDAPDTDTVELNIKYILEDMAYLEPTQSKDIISAKRYYLTCPDDVAGAIMEAGLKLA